MSEQLEAYKANETWELTNHKFRVVVKSVELTRHTHHTRREVCIDPIFDCAGNPKGSKDLSNDAVTAFLQGDLQARKCICAKQKLSTTEQVERVCKP